jgi:glycosyltransferase involved in cell wall biosynthesis
VGAAEELAVDERQIVDLDEQRWVEALDGLLRDREPLSRQLMVRSAEYSWEATAQALLEATES